METYGKSLFYENFSEIREELLSKLKNKIYLETNEINSLQEGNTIKFLSEEANKFKDGSEIYIVEKSTNYIKGKVIYEGSFLLNEDTKINEYKLKVFSLSRNSEENENEELKITEKKRPKKEQLKEKKSKKSK
jgi:molybdopterin converting factor small subunit